VAVDRDPQHLGFVLVAANLDVAVSLLVGPLGVGDLDVAGGLQRVALAGLEAALGVWGDAADLVEVIEEGEALLGADLIQRADRLLCLCRGGRYRLP